MLRIAIHAIRGRKGLVRKGSGVNYPMTKSGACRRIEHEMLTKRVLSRGLALSLPLHQGRIDARRSSLPPGPLPSAYSGRHARDGTAPHRCNLPYPPPCRAALGTSETTSRRAGGSSGSDCNPLRSVSAHGELGSPVVLWYEDNIRERRRRLLPSSEGRGLRAVKNR